MRRCARVYLVASKQITEEERVARAELRAANKLAREQRQKEEEEQALREMARNAHTNIWREFNADLVSKGKNVANKNLLANLTDFASELVPLMMTAKEHTALVLDLSEKVASDDTGAGNDTPYELVEKWLSGSIEMSRIPLEPILVNATNKLDAFAEDDGDEPIN